LIGVVSLPVDWETFDTFVAFDEVTSLSNGSRLDFINVSTLQCLPLGGFLCWDIESWGEVDLTFVLATILITTYKDLISEFVA
jgi:hypothetical protein